MRRKANLFINLLNMMLSTGIPELRSHGDVEYLRGTLFLDDSEETAVDNFLKEVCCLCVSVCVCVLLVCVCVSLCVFVCLWD